VKVIWLCNACDFGNVGCLKKDLIYLVISVVIFVLPLHLCVNI
jgi:hypothetical protein